MQSTTGFFAAALAAAGLVLALPATAQQQQQSPSRQQQQTAPSNIPDKKLDQAANAVKRLSAIKDNYEQKLAQAPANEKDKIVGEADEAMAKAITEQGLSIEEYTSIMKVAQNDPAVRDKLIQRLK